MISLENGINRVHPNHVVEANKFDGFFQQEQGKGGAKLAGGEAARDDLKASQQVFFLPRELWLTDRLGKLIRIDEDVFEVLMRAHLRYFLPCEFPTEIIPRPLRHLQRKYPDYVCKRSENIWENRETLIEYHDSLRAEAKIAGVLPSGIQPDVEPSSEEMQPGKRKRPTADGVEVVKDKNAAAIRKATVTQTLFEEVFKRWASHYGVKAQSDSVDPGLERFEPGTDFTLGVIIEY